MTILDFNNPRKILSTEEHNSRWSSDCQAPGTYVPNMSEEDQLKWKAKKIDGKDPRIEIRKTIKSTQVLIVVRPSMISISANGRMEWDSQEWQCFNLAIQEAREILYKELEK